MIEFLEELVRVILPVVKERSTFQICTVILSFNIQVLVKAVFNLQVEVATLVEVEAVVGAVVVAAVGGTQE